MNIFCAFCDLYTKLNTTIDVKFPNSDQTLDAARYQEIVSESAARIRLVRAVVLISRRRQIVKMMKGHGYELCAQNVIILDRINEYFLIDRRNG